MRSSFSRKKKESSYNSKKKITETTVPFENGSHLSVRFLATATFAGPPNLCPANAREVTWSFSDQGQSPLAQVEDLGPFFYYWFLNCNSNWS
jgi:hypothetical protein